MSYDEIFKTLLFLCIIVSSPLALAVPATFHGTLIEPPPCTINNGKDIDVDFGTDLLTTRVDGINYEKMVPYTIECNVDAKSNLLKLQLTGTGAGFDSTVLATQKMDLAVELRNSGTKMPLNTWVNFVYPTTLVLTAVPVKRANSELTGGAFNATGTMQVDYQ